jgi:hypothetical protein
VKSKAHLELIVYEGMNTGPVLSFGSQNSKQADHEALRLMLLAETAGNYQRPLIVGACLTTLAVSGLLSAAAIANHQAPQHRQNFGRFVSVPDTGPLCQQVIFDNDTSHIVSSKSVECNPVDIKHNLAAPLATLRRGFTGR